jgi:hypothetical protein
MHTFKLGDFARNVESGWLGKIVAIVKDPAENGEPTAEMIGVDPLAFDILGLAAEQSLSPDDKQWFALADLVPAFPRHS